MCLTEYNEAETMNLFKEEGREEERVETVEKLIRKGKNIEEIADLLDFSLDFVREIDSNINGH